MATKLFVGGLSWDTKEESLQTLFAQAGTVTSVAIITDRYSGRSRGFGFVEMGSEEEAQRAIQQFNGTQLDGRSIVVNEAKPQAPREDRGGRSFGGGGGGGGFRGGHGGGGGFRGGRDDRGGRNW